MKTPTKVVSEESTSSNGLTVFVIEKDDGTTQIDLDWDPETHPEYNMFSEMGEEELVKSLMERLQQLLEEEEQEKEKA